jgi:hypothetical protein
MKINIEKDIDRESFMVHEHILNGELVYLVQPKHIGAKWKKDNLHFRSSVWNYNGELISASFPKFFNWGEQPDLSPVPTSLKNATVVEKLDGSTLIVSKHNGKYILRTRGTVDASTLANGHELEIFKNTILKTLDVCLPVDINGSWHYSILFEWVSPINKIVLNYGDEPDWYLVGVVNHDHYSVWSQSRLNEMGNEFNLKRPPTYTFSSVEDLLKDVDQWRGKEGVVVYSKNDQMLHKVKAMQYLKCHAFKSNATFENTIEMFFEFDMPSYQDFEVKLIEKFDYECYQMVRGHISTICDGYKEILNIVEGMHRFVDKIKLLNTRKEQATAVFSSYGKESNRSSYIFTILDGKKLSKEQLKKLLYQVTKK